MFSIYKKGLGERTLRGLCFDNRRSVNRVGEVRFPCNSWLWWPSLRLTFLTLSHFMLAWWHSLNRKVNYFYLSPKRLRFWLCPGNRCLARRQFLLLRQAANFVFFHWHCKGTKFSMRFQIILQKKHAKKHAAWNAFRFATVLQLLQFFLGLFYSSDYTYIYIYINIEEFLSLKIGFF